LAKPALLPFRTKTSLDYALMLILNWTWAGFTGY